MNIIRAVHGISIANGIIFNTEMYNVLDYKNPYNLHRNYYG